MFENEVLKKIPKQMKIGLVDLNKNESKSNELKNWLKKL